MVEDQEETQDVHLEDAPPEDATLEDGHVEESQASATLGSAASSSAEEVVLHLACKDFQRISSAKVQKFLTEKGGVPLRKVFKLPQWSYAFVNLLPEDADSFREAIGNTMYRNNSITISEGKPRKGPQEDGGSKKREGLDGDGPPGKRQREGSFVGREKDGFPPGYVPTLKDLKDKSKTKKGVGLKAETIAQKTCPLLEWSYETQLNMKDTYVKSAVRSLTKQIKKRCEDIEEQPPDWTGYEWSVACKAPLGCGCPLAPPIGTPAESLQGYRNKCEFTIGCPKLASELLEEGQAPSQALAEVGFVLKMLSDGDQAVGSCEDVPVVPDVMKKLCAVARRFVRASPYALYDRRRGTRGGVWRLLMVRMSSDGKVMLMVQTTSLDPVAKENISKLIIDSFVEADLGVASIYLQFNDEATDAARPDAPVMCIYGQTHISMPLLGLKFDLGPLSFFQTNAVTCATLYETALNWLRPEDSVVLDVCCGVGTIGLCASRRCREVIGLELVEEAVLSARHNAEINGIGNARFCVGKAEEVLPSVIRGLPEGVDVSAVVDPPRPGLHHAVTTALRNCSQLSRIVYISCNPESLVEDVIRLTMPRESSEDAFVPVRAVAVDMFPHTLHCEMILLLERSSRVKDIRKSGATEASATPQS